MAVEFDRSAWEDPAPNLTAEQYAAVSLIDLNPPGAAKIKSKCKLPIRKTPGSPPNIHAVESAARLIGRVDAPADQIARAARILVRLLRADGQEPSDSLLQKAKG